MDSPRAQAGGRARGSGGLGDRADRSGGAGRGPREPRRAEQRKPQAKELLQATADASRTRASPVRPMRFAREEFGAPEAHSCPAQAAGSPSGGGAYGACSEAPGELVGGFLTVEFFAGAPSAIGLRRVAGNISFGKELFNEVQGRPLLRKGHGVDVYADLRKARGDGVSEHSCRRQG